MIASDLIRKVRKIQIRTSHVVDDLLAGGWHSAFKGRGIEFEEVRPYQSGDDVRSIDWNVTARAGQPFIKLFQEERELTVILLVDASASLFFGSTSQTKHELVTELAATLAFSAIKNQDKVGLTLFSEQVEYSLPPRKGVNDVLRLIRTLLLHRPEKQGTNLRVVLEHLNRTVKRRSVVFLLSDFQDTNFEKPLRIAARRHDLIPIVVSDDREKALPPVGLLPLRDAESGAIQWFDTSSRRHRFLFTRAVEKREQTRENLFKKLGLRSIQLSTGQDYVEALQQFFRSREKRA
ncbi:MAG: DUF58 domain-containing protein [Planctomycetota bacterium]|nr:DUF58 domain-containing protein [Planctomycetota bacterium]MEC7678785.1 DUF58 domain-containing protein [Planctomycetota bacterium]